MGRDLASKGQVPWRSGLSAPRTSTARSQSSRGVHHPYSFKFTPFYLISYEHKCKAKMLSILYFPLLSSPDTSQDSISIRIVSCILHFLSSSEVLIFSITSCWSWGDCIV